MKKVYILGACRTPIGKMGGALSEVPAVELGAIVIREALLRADIEVNKVDHVYMGTVIQAGLGQNVARQAAIKAGLPYSTTAETLNVVCGSGLDSVNSAARLIQSGDADIVVAGGMENMSMAPFAILKARYGYRMGYPAASSELVDTMIKDALWESFNDCHMGMTAEYVAERWKISREDMDCLAAESQMKAVEAIKNGAFDAEVVPVIIKGRKKELVVRFDEGPRAETTVEGLAKLSPVFKMDGKVTAGNASTINDGAAAVVLVSEEKVKELGLKPMAEWCAGALGGIDPMVMGVGPIVSTKKVLEKTGLRMEDIDLIEANEAFASTSLAVAHELKFDMKKVNVNGGAIALGHPVGASGCRILVTLLHAMKARTVKFGLATLCIGGGMGCSTIVKNCDNI